MRIKMLLTTLTLLCGLQSFAYGQQAIMEENFSLSTSHFQLHKAPPRKEIRHKITQHPQDNDLQSSSARASGEYIMAKFPTMGEIRGVVILAAFADVPFSVSADSINNSISRTLLSHLENGLETDLFSSDLPLWTLLLLSVY